MQLAGWLIDSQEFSQVVRSSRVEAINNKEKRVCTVSVNQWATNEEMQDEEKCGPFQKLSGQGEQRCSETSVVCLGDIEVSQKEESYNNLDVKEQRQRQEQNTKFNSKLAKMVISGNCAIYGISK